MKKIFTMLITLFILYLGIQAVFTIFSKGHEYEYVVSTDNVTYNIKETMIHNVDGEINNYYFEISYGDSIFYYQTFRDFNNSDRVIDKIYSYNNENYNCILPIFKDNIILSDIMCKKDNTITFYHDLINKDSGIDQFAKSLSDKGYDSNLWVDSAAKDQSGDILTYQSNILKNNYLMLSNYKGLYVFDKGGVDNIKLFASDNYKQEIKTVVNKFYVVADYSSQYRFNKFLVVDLTNGKKDEITFDVDISFDSYVQGVHGDSFYIFDRNTKTQYEINVAKKTLLEIGNEKSEIKIYNGNQAQRITATDAKNQDVLFDFQNIINEDYDKVYKLGGEKSGFYYLFKKDGSKYKVYRTNVQNNNQRTYLFDTTDINRIIYKGDNVYYIYNDTINYFNDNNGKKRLIEYSEIKFNPYLYFNIYTQ